MFSQTANMRRFNLHGTAVGITSSVQNLNPEIQHLLRDFRAESWPAGAVPVTGTIWPYEQQHVMRHMSNTARRIAADSDLLEIYEDDERFWLVDDRWGIAEINLLKGQWRSWVLPNPSIDMVRVAQFALLWPMAQLLRARGLYLVPATAVSFADRAFLVLSRFGLEPELTTLIRGGYRIIGQSWTAIREHDSRFSMMNFPGYVERPLPPGMRLSGSDAMPTWIDLMHDFCGAEQKQAWCDAVLVVENGRRPQASARPLDRMTAGQTLRQAWPIFDLHPNRRHGQLPARLAQKVPCYRLTLSREPRDLLGVLGTLSLPATDALVRGTRYRVAV